MGPLRRERCSLVGRLRQAAPPKRAASAAQPQNAAELPMGVRLQRKPATPPKEAKPALAAMPRIVTPTTPACLTGTAAPQAAATRPVPFKVAAAGGFTAACAAAVQQLVLPRLKAAYADAAPCMQRQHAA